MPLFLNFLLKCRDNGELPVKNDDFVLTNGHCFCNSRYVAEAKRQLFGPDVSFCCDVHLLFKQLYCTFEVIQSRKGLKEA